MKLKKTFYKIILLALGVVFCENNALAQVQKPAPTTFEQRMTESVSSYKLKLKQDSLLQINQRKAMIDSMKSVGLVIPVELQETAPRSTSMNLRSGSMGIQSVATANLGFEDDLTGWGGEYSYDLDKITGVHLRKYMSAPLDQNGKIDQSGVVKYPDVVSGFPNGVPSLLDPQPYTQGSTITNQQARISIINDKTKVDPYGGFQIVPDFVGSKVCRIGNNTVGFYKDGWVNGPYPALREQESMSHTFIVDPSNPYIVVNYAVVLADPSTSEGNPLFPNYVPHTSLDKTYFKITLKKPDNSLLTCATYEVYAISKTNNVIPGFINSDVPWEYTNPALTAQNYRPIVYKPWSRSLLDLSAYSGQEVTLTFATGDCTSGGHFGYAYVDAYATGSGISTTSAGVEKTSFCAGETINFSSFMTGRYSVEDVQWSFGDAAVTKSSLREPSFSYTIPGTYVVKLEIISSVPSCPITKTITIVPPLNGSFTVNDLTPAPGQTLTLTVTGHVSGNINQVNWGDNTAATFPTASATHVYSKSGTYKVTVTTTKTGSCTATSTQTLDVMYLCASDLPSAKNGTFLMDKVTGNIVYTRAGCSAQALMPCVIGTSTKTSKVISADATVFSDNWPYKTAYADNSGTSFSPNADQFETGERGKWRVKSTYTHNTSLLAEDKNFKAGTFDLQNFNWKKEGINANKTKWLLGTEVTAYSPHGDALSERNILGIESAAKFGYSNSVPYMTAKNASLSNTLFESFEMVYPNNMLEDKMKKPSTGSWDDIRISNSNYSHSGFYSWRLSTGGGIDLSEFKLSSTQMIKGLNVKIWLRQSKVSSYATLLTNTIFSLKVKNQTSTAVPLKVVSRTGDWILCEATITSFGTVAPNTAFTLAVQYDLNEIIWIDDVRVQPTDAEMNCYVYDKSNLKLLAVFDDQHFGLYYQYNGEGKLIRKMKETERGVKTIQETQYNTNLR